MQCYNKRSFWLKVSIFMWIFYKNHIHLKWTHLHLQDRKYFLMGSPSYNPYICAGSFVDSRN